MVGQTIALSDALSLPDGLVASAPGCRFARIVTMPPKDDSSAVGSGDAGNKAVTGRGMVKAASWSDFAFCATNPAGKPAAGSSIEPAAEERTKPKPSVVAVKTERVPDEYIQMLLKRPRRKLTPLPERFYKNHPKLRESDLVTYAKINMLVDAQEDILKQYHKKGYALVRVEVTDNGLKKLCRLAEEATA